jgi:hypothetical protein
LRYSTSGKDIEGDLIGVKSAHKPSRPNDGAQIQIAEK